MGSIGVCCFQKITYSVHCGSGMPSVIKCSADSKQHFVFTFQIVTIDLVKKSYGIYGPIEKIEIFRDCNTNIQFAHVTFKESRASYLALIDNKQNASRNIELVRPAFAHQQPDNSMNSGKSSFYSLPDECILRIFENLDHTTLATLSVVCKKVSRLLKDHVFVNMCRFEGGASSDAEVEKTIIAASRIIQCIEPKSFHMKIFRNLSKSHLWPAIIIDFCYTEKRRLSIEMEFLIKKWLCKLEPIARLIDSIHFRCTIYDDALPYNLRDKVIWPNATVLIISGYTMRKPVPDFSSVVASLPKLQNLFIRNLFFNLNLKEYCSGKNLRNIVFENCSFISDKTERQIWKVVNVVKQKKNDFPLCIKFDRIKYLKTEGFLECSNVKYNNTYYMNYNQTQSHEQHKRKFLSWNESTYDVIKSVSFQFYHFVGNKKN